MVMVELFVEVESPRSRCVLFSEERLALGDNSRGNDELHLNLDDVGLRGLSRPGEAEEDSSSGAVLNALEDVTASLWVLGRRGSDPSTGSEETLRLVGLRMRLAKPVKVARDDLDLSGFGGAFSNWRALGLVLPDFREE
jgi:hypothetical protein